MTCGFETTLLILAHMFKIDILILRQDFVWISSKVAPIMCPVVLVQDETGFFLGTCTDHPIYVGSVPVVTVPYSIMNEGLFATSTPSCTSNRPTNTVFSCALSPINSDNTLSATNKNVGNKRRKKCVDKKMMTDKKHERKSQPVWTAVRNQEMYKKVGTDTSTTSQETKMLRQQIKKFEENTLDKTETNSQLSTTVDPNENKKCEDLSTTINPNKLLNEDDAQRTDIGSHDVPAVSNGTLPISESNDVDKSCTKVQSTMLEDKQGDSVESQGEGNYVKTRTKIEMTPTELNEGLLESSESNADNGKPEINESDKYGKNSDIASQPLFSEEFEDTTIT